MHLFLAAVAVAALSFAASAGHAQTIYPIDRAEILAGARFDFKVEFPGLAEPNNLAVTVNDEDYLKLFGKRATFVEREDGQDQSALLLRDVSLPRPGLYKIRVSDGMRAREVSWTVYDTGPRRAKNVILFIGDGMSPAHRIAARLLAKGIAEGKSFGKLAMDDMPHMALVATAGTDSIITDSANSASAYATGHKSAVNAMGVYADRTMDPFDDPRVETITSLVKRRLGMAVGIVTNTEIEDATPAAMVAHTRRRTEYDRIVEQFLAAKPEVIMGGGSANFLPKSAAGSRRKDDVDYIARFRDAGYSVASTAAELATVAGTPATIRLLGLFTPGNMDGALDRKFLKGGTVERFPDQPDLTDQVGAALTVLSKNEAGFFLMVESGMIDKYTHLLDMERAVYDTIMLDNAVKVASDWARARRRYADPGPGRPQSSDQPHRYDRRRHGRDAQRADARAGSGLRTGRISQLPRSRCARVPGPRRREPPPGVVLGQPAGPLRDVPPQAGQSEQSDRGRARAGQFQGQRAL